MNKILYKHIHTNSEENKTYNNTFTHTIYTHPDIYITPATNDYGNHYIESLRETVKFI